jgi:hypothetical protein
MAQPGSNHAFPSLPPPREIVPKVHAILAALGRGIPTLEWLHAKYPHLPRAATTQPTTQAIAPSVAQQISSNVNAITVASNIEMRLPAAQHRPQAVDTGTPFQGGGMTYQYHQAAQLSSQLPFSGPQSSIYGLLNGLRPQLGFYEEGEARHGLQTTNTGAHSKYRGLQMAPPNGHFSSQLAQQSQQMQFGGHQSTTGSLPRSGFSNEGYAEAVYDGGARMGRSRKRGRRFKEDNEDDFYLAPRVKKRK